MTIVGAAEGRGVGVGVFAGLKVGVNVGGSVTLNPTVTVEASRLELPEKLAVSDVISGTLRCQSARDAALGVGGTKTGAPL
jgi:hypothetical protein